MMGRAVRVYAETAWRRLRRGRIGWGSLAVAALPVLVCTLGLAVGRFGVGLFDEAMEMNLQILLPLAPTLLAAAVVGEELEARTYTYLWARPAPRAALVLGKCAVYALALEPAFLVGAAATYAVALSRTPGDLVPALPHFGRVAATVALGVPVYTGVAAGVGTLLARRPVLAGLVYILVVELLFARIPGVLKALAVSFYLRAVGGMELLATPGVWEPRPGPWTAAVVAVALGVAWLALAAWLVTDAEYRESP